MSSTIYRKYRPANFSEVVGQNHVKITLQSQIQDESIAHAYLFCGPRGIGKTTLARVFSKAINCQNKKGADPCNECDICKEINDSRNMDIIEIDAASHTGVDNVRENIIASARIAPSRSKYKVFIIDEVHMLSISAFNALLKIIEEPPAFVVFIFCTTEIHKMPATIISRCQRFDFKRISSADIVKRLAHIANKEGINVEKEVLEAIARHSEGHMRDAESLFGQVIAIGGKNITKEEAELVIPRSNFGEISELIEMLSLKDCAKSIALINKIADEGAELKTFTISLIEVLRKIMLTKINPNLSGSLSLDIGEDMEININQATQNVSISDLADWIEIFSEAQNKIKASFIAQLPLELAITKLCLQEKVIRTERAQSQPRIQTQNQENINNTTVKPNPVSTPTTPPSTNNISGINHEEIKKRWNEVLIKIKKHNHSLSFILRVCEPRLQDDNKLCLAFKYKFHKDRMDDVQIREIVQGVLQEVYGARLDLESTIDADLNIENEMPQNISTPTKTEQVNEQENVDEVKPADVKTSNKENTANVPQEQDSGEAKQAGDMMSNLLDTFGGKVLQ